MRTVRRTTQFRKDVKRMGRRGKKLEEFKEVIGKLGSGKAVRPPRVSGAKSQDWFLVKTSKPSCPGSKTNRYVAKFP